MGDYGYNFGFRVSDESRRSSNGRCKTPATGNQLRLGTAVEIDPADPTRLRQGAANVHARPGTSGLLLMEEFDVSIYESTIRDTYSWGLAKLNRLAVITNGNGVKVWFRNNVQMNRGDGRVIPAVQMFDPATVAVGRGLAWNGTHWVDVADPRAATSFMEVSLLDTSAGAGKEYLEAFLVV